MSLRVSSVGVTRGGRAGRRGRGGDSLRSVNTEAPNIKLIIDLRTLYKPESIMVFMYPTSLSHCTRPFHPIVGQIPERGGHQTNNQQIKTLPQHNCTGCELVANLDCLDEGGSHGFIHCRCSSISSYSQITQYVSSRPLMFGL